VLFASCNGQQNVTNISTTTPSITTSTTTTTTARPVTECPPPAVVPTAAEHGIGDHLAELFSKPVPIIVLAVGLVALVMIVCMSSVLLHVVLVKCRGSKSEKRAPTKVVVKGAGTKRKTPDSNTPATTKPDAKKAKNLKQRKRSPDRGLPSGPAVQFTKPEADEDLAEGPVENPVEKPDVVSSNPLAPDYIPPEKFTHLGPLVIPKHQKFEMKHELNDKESDRSIKAHEHFKFDDALNTVYDIGSEVEIVKSSSVKPKKPFMPSQVEDSKTPQTKTEGSERTKNQDDSSSAKVFASDLENY